MEQTSSPTVAHVLGEITWLLSQTSTHKHLQIADLETRVIPALLLKQFRIFYSDNTNKQPVAFAVWAALSDEADKAYTAQLQAGGAPTLELKDWRSGNNFWLLELVSPFANEENKLLATLRKNLEETVFAGKTYRFLNVHPTTGTKTLAEFDEKEMGHG